MKLEIRILYIDKLNIEKPEIHAIQGISGFISNPYNSEVVDEVYDVNHEKIIDTAKKFV